MSFGSGSHQPKPAAARHPEHCLYCPPVVIGWITHAGGVLDFMLVGVWGWLYERGEGYPSEFDLRLTDLAGYFHKSTGRASRWIAALAAEGLLVVVKEQRGPAGYVRVRLLDPYESAQRTRLERGEPQADFPFVEEPDTLPALPNNVAPVEAPAQQSPEPIAIVAPTEARAQQSDSLVAAGDVPPALWEALCQQLGASRAELWLGQSRWAFGPRTKVYVGTEFARLAVRQDLQTVLANLGLPPAEIALDPELAIVAPPPAIVAPMVGAGATIPAQQPTLVRSRTQASNQPTNQPANFLEPGTTAGEQPLLRQAAALYARVDDGSLYRWMAIAAVLLVDEGYLAAADLERLVQEHAADFGHELKRQVGRHWPKMGWLKGQLLRRGIKWKRQWERGAHGKEQR